MATTPMVGSRTKMLLILALVPGAPEIRVDTPDRREIRSVLVADIEHTQAWPGPGNHEHRLLVGPFRPNTSWTASTKHQPERTIIGTNIRGDPYDENEI